ncbi:MAG: UDP-N-acetylmuramoyl-tripeptide--D-alanyl-D-alanine ligase [Lachnospiraceae bacterium]
MRNMSLEQITSVCGGTYYGDSNSYSQEINGVVIDSRKVAPGYLFVPIKGERVDGHDYIPQVMKKGALCSFSEHLLEHTSHPYILVDSCVVALQTLAAYYRDSLDIKVVGITGSVGKTSTKEMVASVLAQKYKVLKTEGNFNNELGLPLTIFQIRDEHEIAVLEMGIGDFNEMHCLAAMAKPDVCVITNIGYAHLENLKSREGILKAKTEMFDHMKPNPIIVLNGEDDMLTQIGVVHGATPIFFGTSNNYNIYATDIKNLGLRGTTCTIHLPHSTIAPTIPAPGIHMVSNALAGACVGYALGLTADEILHGIEGLIPVSGRNHVIETNDLLIIDDCYNANPASMKASLDVLSTGDGRTVAILGDMFELGTDELKLHGETGAYAALLGIDVICCIGHLSKAMANGATSAGSKKSTIQYYETKILFLDTIEEIIQKGDTVLVKASHSMDFSEIVETLRRLSF